MPRKTDGIEFEIHPRPTKGEDGKPLLYVRPAKGRKRSFKELETFCNKYRGLRTGELQMVMDVVMDVVGLWLSDGYRVETPFGSFAPKLKLLGEHTDPKTIHGRDIKYAGIEFIPSKEFIKEGGQNREGYRKSDAQVGKVAVVAQGVSRGQRGGSANRAPRDMHQAVLSLLDAHLGEQQRDHACVKEEACLTGRLQHVEAPGERLELPSRLQHRDLVACKGKLAGGHAATGSAAHNHRMCHSSP